MIINWYIRPLSTPAVIRNCSHCGRLSEFVCCNKFRINAQQKNLDIWLIYQCKKCACSWNMAILSRVKPEELGRVLYNGFLDNSSDLSLKYAFDAQILSRNNVRVCYADLPYAIEGDEISLELLEKEAVTLQISSPYNLQLSLNKLLKDNLGISRRTLEECFRMQAITSEDFGFRTEKSKIIIKGDLTLQFDPSVIQILVNPQGL